MPYAIRKVEGGYAVFNTETGERKNSKPYPSKEAAQPYMRALYSAEGDNKSKQERAKRRKR
jgi:hypothetical protein